MPAKTPHETTLVLVKPDGVQRGLVGEVLGRLERKGLQIVALKMMTAPKSLLEQHYSEHKGKGFYEGLLEFMGGGPIVATAVKGLGAIAIVRKLMGKTNGAEAEPGTIRGDLGMSRSYNLVHGSDGAEAAKKELALFFGKGEIHEWNQARLDWAYDPKDER
jgi:nucleoside-diphosphate kinase